MANLALEMFVSERKTHIVKIKFIIFNSVLYNKKKNQLIHIKKLITFTTFKQESIKIFTMQCWVEIKQKIWLKIYYEITKHFSIKYMYIRDEVFNVLG